MLHLTHAIDRASGYVYLAPSSSQPPDTVPVAADTAASAKPNTYSLFTTAAGQLGGAKSDIRDVQERWIDARDEWDAHEQAQWKKEGEMLREEKQREETSKAKSIRQR
jgi:hypothetical protein